MKRKKILVTGSSRGIGKALAFAFAKEGFHVYVNCRTSLEELKQVEKEILNFGGSCEAILADVSNATEVTQLFAQIEKDGAGLELLINNAGLSHLGLFQEMTDLQWKKVIDTNLSAAFYCSRATVNYMLSQKKGKIINISSIWGNVGASYEVAYSAAKAGLDGLTKALAKELAPSNIQVNAVSCGFIDTAMNGALSTAEKAVIQEEIPMGRFCQPEEVAAFVLDLCLSHDYLTGQIISLNGGWH